jgi:atypical dual specificity phosphatase
MAFLFRRDKTKKGNERAAEGGRGGLGNQASLSLTRTLSDEGRAVLLRAWSSEDDQDDVPDNGYVVKTVHGNATLRPAGHPKATVIFKWLIVGGIFDAHNPRLLSKHKVTSIVNLSLTEYTPPDKICNFKQIAIDDTVGAAICRYFPAVTEYIDRCRAAGNVVLVHCEYGISRSVAFIMAYLMRYRKLDVLKAFDVVRSCRPLAMTQPNPEFLEALLKWDKICQKKPASCLEKSADPNSSNEYEVDFEDGEIGLIFRSAGVEYGGVVDAMSTTGQAFKTADICMNHTLVAINGKNIAQKKTTLINRMVAKIRPLTLKFRRQRDEDVGQEQIVSTLTVSKFMDIIESGVKECDRIYEKVPPAAKVAYTELSDVVTQHKNHIAEHILTLHCPECGQAFFDFSNCFALWCSRCESAFCAYCQESCRSERNDAHAHVARCQYNIAPGKSIFASRKTFEYSQNLRRCRKVKEYLVQTFASKNEQFQVVQGIQNDLEDLGIDVYLDSANKTYSISVPEVEVATVEVATAYRGFGGYRGSAYRGGAYGGGYNFGYI